MDCECVNRLGCVCVFLRLSWQRTTPMQVTHTIRFEPVSRPIKTHCGRALGGPTWMLTSSARDHCSSYDSAEVCVQLIVLFQLTSQVKVYRFIFACLLKTLK